jgi:hypothetical protein
MQYPSVAIDISKKKHIGRKRYGKRDDFLNFVNYKTQL